jgi:heat shock protein HslJ
MEQERQISIALQRSASAVQSGDTLKVRDSTGAAVLTLLRRHSTGADAKRLTGTAWTFRQSTIGALDSAVTLQFTADSVSGFAGCRHFTGTYHGKGDRLSFTSMAMEVDCPDARRQLSEGTFTTALSETSHFALMGDELVLLTWGGDTLRFARRR